MVCILYFIIASFGALACLTLMTIALLEWIDFSKHFIKGKSRHRSLTFRWLEKKKMEDEAYRIEELWIASTVLTLTLLVPGLNFVTFPVYIWFLTIYIMKYKNVIQENKKEKEFSKSA